MITGLIQLLYNLGLQCAHKKLTP